MGNTYKKGAVVNVDLGQGKELLGYDMESERPCVVLQSFPEMGLVIVAPCTAKVPKEAYYTNIKLPKGTANLKKTSFMLCHQLRTISCERVLETFGFLDDAFMVQIQAVLSDIFELR
jgi:mRNA interferase MazF